MGRPQTAHLSESAFSGIAQSRQRSQRSRCVSGKVGESDSGTVGQWDSGPSSSREGDGSAVALTIGVIGHPRIGSCKADISQHERALAAWPADALTHIPTYAPTLNWFA